MDYKLTYLFPSRNLMELKLAYYQRNGTLTLGELTQMFRSTCHIAECTQASDLAFGYLFDEQAASLRAATYTYYLSQEDPMHGNYALIIDAAYKTDAIIEILDTYNLSYTYYSTHANNQGEPAGNKIAVFLKPSGLLNPNIHEAYQFLRDLKPSASDFQLAYAGLFL